MTQSQHPHRPSTEPPTASSATAELRILLIEDDAGLREATRDLLVHRGFRVLEAENCARGLESSFRNAPDVVIIDLRLPDGQGDQLCAELRRRGFSKPIVILTAFESLDNHVKGLDCGADDFWAKPIPSRLLESRLRALVRRALPPPAAPSLLELNGIHIDFRHRTAHRGGDPFTLGAREFALLEVLWMAQGAPVSRTDLLARAWQYTYVPHSRTVDNYVVALRKKLEPDPSHPRHLLTVPGVGYRLEASQAAAAPNPPHATGPATDGP